MKTLEPNKRKKVSHHDVQKAVQQFLKSGGIIVRLPEQQSQARTVVGGEKYEDYESLAALLSS